LRLPTPQEPDPGNSRWSVIRYALDSNARTIRLCLIRLVAIGPPVAATVVEVSLDIHLQTRQPSHERHDATRVCHCRKGRSGRRPTTPSLTTPRSFQQTPATVITRL